MADATNDKKAAGESGDARKRKAPAKSKKGSSILDEAKAVFKDLDTSDGRKLRKRSEKQTPKAAPKKAAAKGKAKAGSKKAAKKDEEKPQASE